MKKIRIVLVIFIICLLSSFLSSCVGYSSCSAYGEYQRYQKPPSYWNGASAQKKY